MAAGWAGWQVLLSGSRSRHSLGETQLALRDQCDMRGGQDYYYKAEGLAELQERVPPEGRSCPRPRRPPPGLGRRATRAAGPAIARHDGTGRQEAEHGAGSPRSPWRSGGRLRQSANLALESEESLAQATARRRPARPVSRPECSGTRSAAPRHPKPPAAVAFSPDGQRIDGGGPGTTGQRRGLPEDPGEPVRAHTQGAEVDVLDRRRHRQLRQRPAVPAPDEPAAPAGRGPDRGDAQLLPLPRPAPAAEQSRPVRGPRRGRPLPLERRAPAGPDRPRRQADRIRRSGRRATSSS